ncbi:DUF2200 family protein [Lacticaseibacillus baoqingensis]|uniref:DUF2200 family protein n=1 Tax=Lacticaseibacillus baoqingensis TaxID=2486013 RepID=A0ABW4E4X6_9LACO|nr:DUF2200 family protein [Lacticaseibacillus baoqingensis]
MSERIFALPFNQLYPLYLNKIQRKGRTQAELDAVLRWLTGYDTATLHTSTLPLRDFFTQAQMPLASSQITGVICGVRVETIRDPLLQQIRQMDKVVDELAKGKAIDQILR